MARKKTLLIQVGETVSGRRVYAGIYRFCETMGVPLTDLLYGMQALEMVPSWLHFYDEALAAGMKHDRVMSRIGEAVVDAYGRDHRNAVLSRVRHERPPDLQERVGNA